MTHRLSGTPYAFAAALAAQPVSAENDSVTVVAGHPPVFRWVRMIIR